MNDANTLPLGSYFAVENLFDTTYATGRTTEGVVSIGVPRLVRGGVRLSF